jgi:hypothetical protein
MLADENIEAVKRVTVKMMGMKKLEISGLREAFSG